MSNIKDENKKIDTLPIISFETGIMELVSFVEKPAYEEDWVFFSKEDLTLNFKIENEEKRIVTGVAMISDKPVYRNINGIEFFIKFSKEAIEDARNKLMKSGNIHGTRIDHTGSVVNDVYVVESWIVNDPETDKSKTLGLKAGVGDLFLSYKVENDEIWNKVKNGEVKAFSIEALGKPEIDEDMRKLIEMNKCLSLSISNVEKRELIKSILES